MSDTSDGMTADYRFDAAFLGINRVVHDYALKPTGTIEWE